MKLGSHKIVTPGEEKKDEGREDLVSQSEISHSPEDSPGHLADDGSVMCGTDLAQDCSVITPTSGPLFKPELHCQGPKVDLGPKGPHICSSSQCAHTEYIFLCFSLFFTSVMGLLRQSGPVSVAGLAEPRF